jgi:hypothetical protein
MQNSRARAHAAGNARRLIIRASVSSVAEKILQVCVANKNHFGVRPASFCWNVAGFSHNAVLFVVLITSAATIAGAEENNGDKLRGTFGVKLQPFSADDISTRMQRAEMIRVAYYAPRAQPVTPPQHADSAEEEMDAPSLIVSSGARPMISGSRAVLRNGIAYAPSRAPANVQNAIWAVNTLRRKPYIWGGGHGTFYDRGYDCSGTVSFALHSAGLLATPIPSSDFCRYGERGRGRWITIYSRPGHTFAVIAGLRLDTTDLRYGGDVGPRWYVDGRNTRGFSARHPASW